jgi:hypothetical protein
MLTVTFSVIHIQSISLNKTEFSKKDDHFRVTFGQLREQSFSQSARADAKNWLRPKIVFLN